MDLVIDANILFSALIKNATTTELLFHNEIKLYTPDFIIQEYAKYQDLLLKKTHMEKEEFIKLIHQFKEIITIIPQDEYKQYMNKAKQVTPDENDTMYFALALKMHCPIWTNDQKLKEQNKVIIYSTKELIELI